MNRISIIGIIAILGLLHSSCSKEFSFETGEVENKLVVNSFVKNTQEMEITVSKDFTGTENLEALENAQVAIFKEDVFVENLTYSKEATDVIGKFSTSFIPSPMEDYRVEVLHPGFVSVEANAVIPLGVAIKDASVKSVGGNSYNFSFTLEDPTEANYYFLKMYFRGYELDSITQERKYVWQEPIGIPMTAIPDGQQYLDNGFIFKDETFGGRKVTIAGVANYLRISRENLGLMLDLGGPPESVLTDDTTLYIYLETLSEDAYKYYNSHSTFLNILDYDIFGEATSLFSNVENGYGIFAGVYVSTVGVEVEY